MNKTEIAENLFNEGYNCSQSVLRAYSEEYGLSDDFAFSIASGFGGGMGRMQETCGAVTGAFMVIGLESWNNEAGIDKSKEITYSLINEFVDRFIKRNNTISCWDLLKCDLTSEEGKQYFKQNNLKNKVCLKCIKDSVEILELMMNEKYK